MTKQLLASGLVILASLAADSESVAAPQQLNACGASPARASHAATYDGARKQVVIFGGVYGDAFSNALWGWNGSTWQCIRSDGPSPRGDAVLAYDARRRVLVLHGGRVGRTTLQETWELDANGWQMKSQSGPTPDAHPAMAYDSTSGGVLMFASVTDDGPARATWRWDGTRWTKVTDHPEREFPDAMLASTGRTPTMLVTARKDSGNAYTAAMYEWRSGSWSSLASSGTMPAFSPQVPVARTRTGAVLYAGFERDASVNTFVLERTTWRRLESASPPRRRGATMTFDVDRGVVVLHGGDDGNRILGDTWEFDGATWRNVTATQSPLPIKRDFTPTVADITTEDLKSRVYVFADDSMGGRIVGSAHAMKAADIIANELQRLGLRPAGTHGYFQDVPVGVQTLDSASTFTSDGNVLRAGTDFVAFAGPRHPGLSGRRELFYMGRVADTLDLPSPDEVRGKIVVVRAGPFSNPQAWQRSDGFRRYSAVLDAASGSIVVVDLLPPFLLRTAMIGSGYPTLLAPTVDATSPVSFTMTTSGAERLFGQPMSSVSKRTTRPVETGITFRVAAQPARNVVAVLPGSDATLSGQYVAIGAHLDGVGTRAARIDHDSTRAFNRIARPQGQDGQPSLPTAEGLATISAVRDSLRQAHGEPRPDSINNGADDDASGSMGLLEIAEAMVSAAVKPRRSILFVWHTGEEAGMYGSRFYTDNPTVPRDSIVAQLNIDMIGRGRSDDVTGSAIDGSRLLGGEGYLQLLGSRRLSTQLGDLVEEVNRDTGAGLRFDYSMDANGHQQNIYCRSDHYMYARYGIPIVFFTTGGHRDYHMVTDEPQYLDYPHLRRVTQFIHDLGRRLGDLDQRPVVDKPKPDPRGSCRQ